MPVPGMSSPLSRLSLGRNVERAVLMRPVEALRGVAQAPVESSSSTGRASSKPTSHGSLYRFVPAIDGAGLLVPRGQAGRGMRGGTKDAATLWRRATIFGGIVAVETVVQRPTYRSSHQRVGCRPPRKSMRQSASLPVGAGWPGRASAGGWARAGGGPWPRLRACAPVRRRGRGAGRPSTRRGG